MYFVRVGVLGGLKYFNRSDREWELRMGMWWFECLVNKNLISYNFHII